MRGNFLRSAKPLSYADSGVDIRVADSMIDRIKPLVRTTQRPGADTEIGGFGSVFDLKKAGFNDPLLVASNDGVGTKVKIAIETGIHNTIGIDLVAMCVNDLIVQGAEPLFFLDYFATGELDPWVGAEVVSGIADGCRTAGAALIGGETAAMPGLYAVGDYDLAGFVVGAVERNEVLPRPDIGAGDKILGLTSSGIHSNGFSLVRRIIADHGFDLQKRAPFDPSQTLGEALLNPTRIYVRPLLKALKNTTGIKGLAHITGGGLPDNVPRILPHDVAARIDLSSIPVPEVFKWLASCGPVEPSEMRQTFNCGIGMVVVVERDQSASVFEALTAEGEVVVELGCIETRTADAIFFDGQLDLLPVG